MQVIAVYSNARIGTKILCVFSKESLKLSTEVYYTVCSVWKINEFLVITYPVKEVEKEASAMHVF